MNEAPLAEMDKWDIIPLNLRTTTLLLPESTAEKWKDAFNFMNIKMYCNENSQQ